MAPRKAAVSPASGKAKKKQKQPTQVTPQQRVKIMGPTGKLRLEWRAR